MMGNSPFAMPVRNPPRIFQHKPLKAGDYDIRQVLLRQNGVESNMMAGKRRSRNDEKKSEQTESLGGPLRNLSIGNNRRGNNDADNDTFDGSGSPSDEEKSMESSTTATLPEIVLDFNEEDDEEDQTETVQENDESDDNVVPLPPKKTNFEKYLKSKQREIQIKSYNENLIKETREQRAANRAYIREMDVHSADVESEYGSIQYSPSKKVRFSLR